MKRRNVIGLLLFAALLAACVSHPRESERMASAMAQAEAVYGDGSLLVETDTALFIPDHLGSWTTVTSTFLSVDNYVQDPSYTQNFNRYAYCLNNPLKYTDPDGEWAHLVIGTLVGGIVNLATNWGHINTFGEGLAYLGI